MMGPVSAVIGARLIGVFHGIFFGPPLGGITAPDVLVTSGRLTGNGVSEYGGLESELKLANGKFTAD